MDIFDILSKCDTLSRIRFIFEIKKQNKIKEKIH